MRKAFPRVARNVPLKPGANADIRRRPDQVVGGAVLAGDLREGGDGDEIAAQLELLLDDQSREVRDFLRSART